MKSSLSMWGFLFASAALVVAGCGTEVNSGGSGGSGAGNATSSGGSGGAGGAGGVMTGSGGSGGSGGVMTGSGGSGGAGGSMAGSGGSGGAVMYASCDECTGDKGAPANECLAEWNSCMEWKTCVSLHNCNVNGVGDAGPCDDTQEGACCSLLQCEQMGLDQEAITRYRALDLCIRCKTCAGLCETADTYCPVFEPGGSQVCVP